jgi:hypothetical protein
VQTAHSVIIMLDIVVHWCVPTLPCTTQKCFLNASPDVEPIEFRSLYNQIPETLVGIIEEHVGLTQITRRAEPCIRKPADKQTRTRSASPVLKVLRNIILDRSNVGHQTASSTSSIVAHRGLVSLFVDSHTAVDTVVSRSGRFIVLRMTNTPTSTPLLGGEVLYGLVATRCKSSRISCSLSSGRFSPLALS